MTRLRLTATRASGPRRQLEGLAHLKPAFREDGTITAGNASQISDGGAAVVVTSQATAKKLGVEPLGEFVSYGQVAGPTPSLLHQPANAINKALAKAGVASSRRRPDRDERGVCGGGTGFDGRLERPRGQGQRQRRGDRTWSPGRDVRHSPRPNCAVRAQASWRRPSRSRSLRRRRPRRRPPSPVTSLNRHDAPAEPLRPSGASKKAARSIGQGASVVSPSTPAPLGGRKLR